VSSEVDCRYTAQLIDHFLHSEAVEEKNKDKPKKVIPLPKGQAIRTRLYGRVVELFPEGWMTTGLLSRESKSRWRRQHNRARTDVFRTTSEHDESEEEASTGMMLAVAPRYLLS
jgi:hypothetical protein